MATVARIEAQRELDQARIALGSALVFCRVRARDTADIWLQSGDRAYITSGDFHLIRQNLVMDSQPDSSAIQLKNEKAAFSVQLHARSQRVAVQLIAVEPNVLPEDLVQGDELGAILPWALLLVESTLAQAEFLREALASLSPRAYLKTVCERTNADAALLWAKDSNDRLPMMKMVESWGVHAPFKEMSIPLSRGIIGHRQIDVHPTLRRIESTGTYNPYIVKSEGWQYSIAGQVHGGGQLLGALSVYRRDSELNRHLDLDSLLVECIPFIRRVRRTQARSLQSEQIESRLERLQVGVELLGFAHDLAESAENAASRSRELATVLADRTLPATATALFNDLQQEAEVVNRITRSMNRLARGRRAEKTHFDVADEVADIESILLAITSSIKINIPKGLEVKGDPLDLQRIIINLVSNSRHWTSIVGAEITVSANVITSKSGDRRVRIEVQDNGNGMTPEETRRATTMLYTTRRNGLGLGLFVVKRLVERLHGELTIRSIPYGGTTVLVDLPVVGRK